MIEWLHTEAAYNASEPTTDRLEAWLERASIAEFDGGLGRPEAEALAWRVSVAPGTPPDALEIEPRKGHLGGRGG